MRKLWTLLTLVSAMVFVSVAAAQTGPGTSVAVGTTNTTVARSHNINVTIPEVIVLQLQGTNAGTVTFDFNTEAQAYANAVLGGTTLLPTASDMTGLRVFTNDAAGAMVQISLDTPVSTGEGQAQKDLLFDGKTMANWNSAHVKGSTNYTANGVQNVFATAFTTSGSGAVTSSPITFAPNVSDVPGSFTITVTYTATAL